MAGGAKVLLGGARLDRPGWWYALTVLAGVTPDLPVFTEETFGPVAAVVRAPDTEAAVELANDTPYGLGGLGLDPRPGAGPAAGPADRVGLAVRQRRGRLDPRLPFGGICAAAMAVSWPRSASEFTNIRTFWVQPADVASPATLSE